MLDKFFDSVFMDLESLLVPQKCKKKKKKQSKKQNKTNKEEEEKKHPGPTFSHIDRRGLVNKGSITWMPKTNSFPAGQAITKTLMVAKESFIKRVDHTSTCIPILYKLQIHFNGGQNLLSFLHTWNAARYFLSEESCFKNTVHSAKTCMWPYTESLWWTRKHWKSANVFGFDIIRELISKTSFWATYVSQKWYVFSLLICLDVTKFVLLSVCTLIEMTCLKIGQNHCSRMPKVHFRLTYVAKKRLCLKLPFVAH